MTMAMTMLKKISFYNSGSSISTFMLTAVVLLASAGSASV